MAPQGAVDFGVHDKQIVSVKINTGREIIFGDVVVRVSDKFFLAMHVDTDEANAAFISKNAIGRIIL